MGVNTDNIYLSLNITIPASTTKYSLMEENPSTFYDWNYDWKDRRYYTNFVLRDLTDTIKVYFHKDYDEFIEVKSSDAPFVLEDFFFRDVYFTNENLTDITFNIILLSPQSVPIPPNKPINLTYIILEDGSVEITFLDNSENETSFILERSNTSNTEGFGVINDFSYNVEQVVGSIERKVIDDETLTTGTYWYRIKSVKNGVSSFYSDVLEVSI